MSGFGHSSAARRHELTNRVRLQFHWIAKILLRADSAACGAATLFFVFLHSTISLSLRNTD
jgi:sulfite reductase beta subunit-like hemoprotein